MNVRYSHVLLDGVGQHEGKPTNLSLDLNVLDGLSHAIIVKSSVTCPLKDGTCTHVHWRSDVGFEGERHCPHHNFSWTPGDILFVALEYPPLKKA